MFPVGEGLSKGSIGDDTTAILGGGSKSIIIATDQSNAAFLCSFAEAEPEESAL